MRLPQTPILTVDIFDTVLMRKTYPEARQFLAWAVRAQAVVEENLGRKPHAYALYTLRERARRLLNHAAHADGRPTEPKLADIMGIAAGELLRGYGEPVTVAAHSALVTGWVSAELATERDHLRPNTALVDEIRRVKVGGAQVYFLSDMYLSTENVNELLAGFGLADAFDGGLTSSDAGGGKYSGDLFRAFRDRFFAGDLDWADVTHIGDNMGADVTAPRALGIRALHYRTWHHRLRRARQGAGRAAVRRRAAHEQSLQRERLHAAREQICTRDPLDAYAFAMSVALIHYAGTLHVLADQLNAPVWYISGEGEALRAVGGRLGHDVSAGHVLPRLNRKQMMRAYAGAAIRKPGFSAWRALLPLFNIGGLDFDTATFLGALDLRPVDLGLTPLTLRGVTVADAVEMIVNNPALLEQVQATFTAAYDEVFGWLAAAGVGECARVVLSDVGWSATIQTLLENALALDGAATEPYGIYLGYTGRPIFDGVPVPPTRYGVLFNGLLHHRAVTWIVEEIWEYMLTAYPDRASLPDVARFWEVFEATAAHFQASDDWIDTATLYEAALPDLMRLFTYPTRAQAGRFAFLDHDIGFGTADVRPLLDRSLRTRHVWSRMLNPKAFYRLLRGQFWRAGFLAWYRLGLLQRPFSWAVRLHARVGGKF